MKAMPDDGIVCLDNGMYKIWFARCYKAYEPNTLLLDNALATMGAGLPSAMAAALLYPDRKVVAVCGDGGFMMNSQEMETAVRLNLNLTVIVINDNAYGMIKWKQNAAHFERFGLELKNPDFVAYANSYGAKGYRVTEADGFSQILHECLHVSKTGVKLIEVPVDYTWANTILDKELPGIIKNMMPKAPRISIALSEATAIPPTPRGFQGPTFNEGSQSGSQDSLKKMSLPEEKPEAADGAPESNEVIGEATPDDVDVSVREEPEITHGTPYLSASSGESVPVDPSESTSIDLAADATVNQEELEIRSYPMYIANKAVRPNSELQVTNKYTSKVVARCALAGAADIDAAIAAAERAMPAMNAMASYERKAVLEKVVLEVKERFEEFAHALCVEAGKPISCVTPSNDDLERVVPPCYWEISSNKDTNFLPIEAGSSGS